MPSEEVIELSVEATNALRAELGLAPLRMGKAAHTEGALVQEAIPSPSDQKEVLEMSVDDTNDLRKKLGLAPLRVTEDAQDGKSSRQALHKPAENVGEAKEIAERMERSKLEREVQKGIASTFSQPALGEEEDSSALSWAAKMRSQKKEESSKKSKKKKTKAAVSLEATYDERDLEGMNVSHGMSELEAGSTTIMTLADAPLLKRMDVHSSKVVGLNEEAQQTLQNVELAERQIQQDGLRRKRQAELGMGRAGGYAGFDDDEFEELGGSQGPSKLTRGQAGPTGEDGKKTRGFTIGATVTEEKDNGNDLFAYQEGKAISLVPTQADVTASDFMTVEEDGLLNKSKKKKKKDTKFKKKKKKDKRHRRKEPVESDDETAAKGLLETLEETAVGTTSTAGRKRRRSHSEDKETSDTTAAKVSNTDSPMETEADDDDAKKRAKYDKIMAKGNLRTAEAFKEKTPETKVVEEEPDDAFLNAALAKARRLRRLKEMSNGGSKRADRGADAVVLAIQSSRSEQGEESMSNGTVTFAVDDTREFTRALRAKAEQAERREARKAQETTQKGEAPKKESKPAPLPENEQNVDEKEDENEDMMELAKDMDEEEDTAETGGFDGTTATAPIGRGLANALSMLRHTGEITGKNAGKEELRGRAKDERTYEDYEALDLKKVVKIGRGATKKDLEFANKEIKLEYRDEHGRLLTRKEAYRELCYQFHGHGSSAKNEERKLRQIERERAERRLASRQVADASSTGGKGAGTLGALKATQKATGKAFVVHRT